MARTFDPTMTPSLTLLVGNKNYSSWSMRAFLPLSVSGLPFAEEKILLYVPGSKDAILQHSPSGKVPALVVQPGNHVIWDSLAIAEYVAELVPEKQLWPADALARAHARSICAEMHSGFQAVRNALSMDIQRRFPFPESPSEALLKDIQRIQDIWANCIARYGGPFLFGKHFSNADAFYAPVATRFVTYNVPVSDTTKAYIDAVLAHPSVKAWTDEGVKETEVLTF